MKFAILIFASLMTAPLSANHSAPAGQIEGDTGRGLVNINGTPQVQGSGNTRPVIPNQYAIQAGSQANVATGNHPGVSPGDASGFGRNLPQNTYVAGAQGAAFANHFAVKFGHHPIIGLAQYFRTIRGDGLTTFLNALEESLINTERALRRGQDTHGEFFFNFQNIHELDDLLYVLDEFIRTGKLPADPHGYTYSDKDTDYVRAKELRNRVAKLIQALELDENLRRKNEERQKAIAAHQHQQHEQPFPPFPINANVAASDNNVPPPPNFGPPPPPPQLPALKPLELGGFLSRSRSIDLSFLSASAAAGRAQLAQETANRQAFQAQMIRILAQTLQTQTVNFSTGLIRGGIPSLWRPVPSYGGPFNPVRFRPTPQTAQTTRQPVGQTTTTRTTPTLPPTSTLTQRTQTPSVPEQQAFRRGPTYGVRAVTKPAFESMPAAP